MCQFSFKNHEKKLFLKSHLKYLKLGEATDGVGPWIQIFVVFLTLSITLSLSKKEILVKNGYEGERDGKIDSFLFFFT